MADFNARSKAAYNKIADDYDNSSDGRFTQKFKRLLLDSINYEINASVLDVACGNGTLLALLNKKKSLKGHGIDISDQMIVNAKDNNPNMEFMVAGCEEIPFEDYSMDIITVCAAYHHFPEVEKFAAEAKRVLKPGGKIYIAEIYLNAILRAICNPFVPFSRSGDVRFYSPDEIVKTFNQFGFKEIDAVIANGVQIISMLKE